MLQIILASGKPLVPILYIVQENQYVAPPIEKIIIKACSPMPPWESIIDYHSLSLLDEIEEYNISMDAYGYILFVIERCRKYFLLLP